MSWENIVGSKKGGGAPEPAREEPDNLLSQQVATLVDVISEGPIEGLYGVCTDTDYNIIDTYTTKTDCENHSKFWREDISIFFDEVAIRNLDNMDSPNYDGTSYQTRTGTPYGVQKYLGYYNTDFDTGTETIEQVTVEVKKAAPGAQTRKVSAADRSLTDVIKVQVSTDQLVRQDKEKGHGEYSYVDFKVDWRYCDTVHPTTGVCTNWGSWRIISGSNTCLDASGVEVTTGLDEVCSYGSSTNKTDCEEDIAKTSHSNSSSCTSAGYAWRTWTTTSSSSSGSTSSTSHTGCVYKNLTQCDSANHSWDGSWCKGRWWTRKMKCEAKGSSYTYTTSGKFSGKTTSTYIRDFKINIEKVKSDLLASGKKLYDWEARVTRITNDDISDSRYKHTNKIQFASLSSIILDRFTYPNTAVVATRLDAKQFGSSLPKRTYKVKGLKIKVPSNYVPETRNYNRSSSGTEVWDASDNPTYQNWDGTFYTTWSDNPAWCFYDIIANDRYGLGKYIPEEHLDKWALFDISKYCDGVENTSGAFTKQDGSHYSGAGVDDGKGNYEARFACNLYLQSQNEAYKVIQDMASIFRGMTYWAGGSIVPVQDSPKDPVYQFTEANVLEGTFNYEGIAKKARHTAISVTWHDPANFHKQKIEYVDDFEATDTLGYRLKEISAFGCTSQAQARRMGEWIIAAEKVNTETVTFKTGLDAAFLKPGDIIKVLDASRQGEKYGGRVSTGSSSTVIKLDRSVSFYANKTYSLSLVQTREACFNSSGTEVQPLTSLGIWDYAKSNSGTAIRTTGKKADLSDGDIITIRVPGGTGYYDGKYTIKNVTHSNTAISGCCTDHTWFEIDKTWQSRVVSGDVFDATSQPLCLRGTGNTWYPTVKTEERTFTTGTSPTDSNTITVSSAFSEVPSSQTIWVMSYGTAAGDEFVPQLFRVLALKEEKKNEIAISALEYNESIYNHIDTLGGGALSEAPTIKIPVPGSYIPPPSDVIVEEVLYQTSNNTQKNRMDVGWELPDRASQYNGNSTACTSNGWTYDSGKKKCFSKSCSVSGYINRTDCLKNGGTWGGGVTYKWAKGYYAEYRTYTSCKCIKGPWTPLGETAGLEEHLLDAPAGTYDVRVQTINSINKRSSWNTLENVVLLGKYKPPKGVSSLTTRVVP